MKGIVQAVSGNQQMGAAPGDPAVTVITVTVASDPTEPGPTGKLHSLSFALPAAAPIPTVGDKVDVTAVVVP